MMRLRFAIQRLVAPFQEDTPYLRRQPTIVSKVVRSKSRNPKYFPGAQSLAAVGAFQRNFPFQHDAGFWSDNGMQARPASRLKGGQLRSNGGVVKHHLDCWSLSQRGAGQRKLNKHRHRYADVLHKVLSLVLRKLRNGLGDNPKADHRVPDHEQKHRDLATQCFFPIGNFAERNLMCDVNREYVPRNDC